MSAMNRGHWRGPTCKQAEANGISSPSTDIAVRLRRLHRRSSKVVAAAILRHPVTVVPGTLHDLLTLQPQERYWSERQWRRRPVHPLQRHIYPVDRISRDDCIDSVLQGSHPWTDGQVERMNRTIRDAAIAPPPRRSRSVAQALRRPHQCLRLWKAFEHPEGVHASRFHVSELGIAAGMARPQPEPSWAMTEP